MGNGNPKARKETQKWLERAGETERQGCIKWFSDAKSKEVVELELERARVS